MNKALLWVCLLLASVSCNVIPGPSSHCGGPGGDPIEEARMYCTLDTLEPNLTANTTFTYFHQKGVYFNNAYPTNPFPSFPLAANLERMEFEIKELGTVKDTLVISYQVGSEYYTGDVCNDPQLIPKAIHKNCFTKNNYYKVIAFH